MLRHISPRLEESSLAYLYWLGAILIVSPLILGIPFLSGNRVYRTATLFAGINVGIITLSFLINLLRWGTGPAEVDQFHTYFMHALPGFYIASLATGATIVSKYYLSASTKIGTVTAALASLLGLYMLSVTTGKLLGILHITITEGLPSFEIISEMMTSLLVALILPNLSLLVLLFISALIALSGTAAIMRMSNETESSEDAV
jgi:hypothetical protein